jgi:hypothetical protein
VSAFIGYPTGRLLAVLDDPAAARDAVADIVSSGIAADDVLLLSGPDDARRFDGTGTGHGLWSRLLRAVQFALMDQLPDFAWY